MPSSSEYFIREFHIDVIDVTLKLNQKIEGDVGCVVWDASIVLAKYLEELHKKDRQYFKKLNVVELGSGVGCVGLTAASLGSNVLLTDLQDVLPILEKNVEVNKECLHTCNGNAQVLPLPWGTKIDMEQKPDLILLADCVYYKESIGPLISTLKSVSGTETKILLSQEIRESKKQQECWTFFLENIKKHFIYHCVPFEEQHEEFRSKDILLIQLLPL